MWQANDDRYDFSISERKKTMTPRTLSLEKAVGLLRAIARAGGDAPISSLAAETGLAPSTTHRLAASLERLGLIVREKRGHYHIGPLVRDLAATAEPRALLARVGRPHLQRLARRHRKTAHLAVFEGDMVTYLAKAHARNSRILTIEGAQLEAYCSGLGKALLAHLPRTDRERYLAEGPFPRLTATTLTEPDALRAELDRIRKRGYALDNAEIIDDLKCVAVPIFDSQGRIEAALSVSGPAADYSPAYIKALAAELQDCAADLSRRLYPGTAA